MVGWWSAAVYSPAGLWWSGAEWSAAEWSMIGWWSGVGWSIGARWSAGRWLPAGLLPARSLREIPRWLVGWWPEPGFGWWERPSLSLSTASLVRGGGVVGQRVGRVVNESDGEGPSL